MGRVFRVVPIEGRSEWVDCSGAVGWRLGVKFERWVRVGKYGTFPSDRLAWPWQVTRVPGAPGTAPRWFLEALDEGPTDGSRPRAEINHAIELTPSQALDSLQLAGYLDESPADEEMAGYLDELVRLVTAPEAPPAPEASSPAPEAPIEPSPQSGDPEAPPVGYEERAVAAAYALLREGKRVSIKAVCDRAGLDRSHLYNRYPDAIQTIRMIGAPSRAPRRGSKSRDGRIEAVDE